MRNLIAVAALAVASASCTGSGPETLDPGLADQEKEEGALPPDATLLPAQKIFDSPVSGILEARRVVVRDARAWETFWEEAVGNVTPPPSPPLVDFDRAMVIVAALGQRGTGGYAIQVAEVREGEDSLYARIVQLSPGPGCLTTQAQTAPVTAVEVPASAKSVVFIEQEAAQNCM